MWCSKRLKDAPGLAVHCRTVHKEILSKVPNAIEGRDDVRTDVFGSQGIPDNLHEERRLKYVRSQTRIPSPPESPDTTNTIPQPPEQFFNHQSSSTSQKTSEYQPNKIIIPPPPQKFTPNNLIKPDPNIFKKIQKRHDQEPDKNSSWRHFETSENVIDENTVESCVSLEEKRF